MKKSFILIILLFYFGCSEDPNAPEESLISEELISNTRTSNAVTQPIQCSDLDNDNFCDDDDYWPLDPEMNQNLWGIINDSQPEFYFTYDIDEVVQEATTNSMLGAIDEFGNWGPIELWVIGQDYEGVSLKAKNFCDIRVRRWQSFFDPFTLNACLEFMLYPQEGNNNLPDIFISTDQRLADQGGYFNY